MTCSDAAYRCVVTVPWLTGMHLWRGEYNSHIRVAQMDFCHRLIVVPLSTFHRMAEKIGDPRGELIFLFITARCGSTLLTQVKQTPHTATVVAYICLFVHFLTTNIPDE